MFYKNFGELKPCPFCDSRASIRTYELHNKVAFFVKCAKCGLQTKNVYVPADDSFDEKNFGAKIAHIMDVWNMRQDKPVNMGDFKDED